MWCEHRIGKEGNEIRLRKKAIHLGVGQEIRHLKDLLRKSKIMYKEHLAGLANWRGYLPNINLKVQKYTTLRESIEPKRRD